MERASLDSWWEWNGGSSLCFWRWSSRYTKDARDGYKVFVKEILPRYIKRQRWPYILKDKCELVKKVHKVRTRGYINECTVKSLTDFFGVPNIISSEERDIKVVYDATTCGLNEAVLDPNFYLPIVDSALTPIECDSWFVDLDVG